MGLSYTEITALFQDGQGGFLSGSAEFTVNVALYAYGVPVVVPGVPVQAKINNSGQLQNAQGNPLQLLDLASTSLVIEGSLTGFWFWTVSIVVGGQVMAPWSFFLNHSAIPVDLFSLAGSPAALVSPLPTTLGGTGLDEPSLAALLAALLASGGGSLGAELSPKVTVLTDAASVAVNAGLGNDFRLTFTSAVGASRTIAAPSNPSDGEKITFELIQGSSGGPYSVSWASGAGGYDFGSGTAPSLSAGAGAIDVVAFRYSAAKGQWLSMGSATGF